MWQFTVAVLIEIHWNTVITIDVFLLLDSEIYLFWLIDWLIDWLIEKVCGVNKTGWMFLVVRIYQAHQQKNKVAKINRGAISILSNERAL